MTRRKKLIALAYLYNKVIGKRRRSCWHKGWMRKSQGYLGQGKLIDQLKNDEIGFQNFTRMNFIQFNILLNLIQNSIAKKDTILRQSITPYEKLIITLRFLATGESYQSLSYQFRISKTSISLIIPEVCEAIYKCLQPSFLKIPSTPEAWKMVAEEFWNKWNFPHCCGSLDGKHIAIRKPDHSASYFYNYKNFFSIVLLALVDANYNFLYIDIGSNGRISDGGIFNQSTLHHILESGDIHFPKEDNLPGSLDLEAPYVILADDAFSLKTYLLKPFPMKDLNENKQYFNYRLSRARRCVENTFGIVCQKFRVLYTTMQLGPDKASIIVKACCVLHNYLNKSTVTGKNLCFDDKYNDSDLFGLQATKGHSSSRKAQNVRDIYNQFFSRNKIEW